VQVLIDDADRREYKCPASILALAKQCCQHDPKQRPDMPAIAGAIASPAVQKSVLKGARDMRPLVRLQRGGGARAPEAVDSQGTYDASHGSYDASKSSLSRSLALSTPLGRQLVRRSDTFAHDLSLDMKATFERPGRMTSRRAGCDSARLSSVSSPRAGSDDAFTSTYDASKDNASSSTFDSSRTFDGNSPTFHL
jgi:hypothetical protein